MDLVNLLVSNLGVSDDQAKGGAGLLFKLAQDKLGEGPFAQVAENLSGVDDMMAAAPSTGGGGLMGAVSSMMSSFGGGSGKLGALAGLAGGFDKLGLDAGMIGKFVPVVLGFAREHGGEGVGKLLEGVLSPK